MTLNPLSRILLTRFAPLLLLLSSRAFGQGNWTQLLPSGGPSGAILARQPVSAGYDAVNNRLIVYFGSNPAVNSNPAPQAWVLTNANGLGGTPVWIQLFPSGSPPVTNGGQSRVYDSATNRLIIYGGCYANCSPALSGVFALTNANGLGGAPAWAPVTVTNPQARATHSAVYDASSNGMIAFGGDFAFPGTEQNDTRVLSNANGAAGPSTWTTLTTSGGPPPIRTSHSAVYDQAANRMTIFAGGPDVGTPFNDVWVLSNANGSAGTPIWMLQTPGGNTPPARRNFSAVNDPANNKMIILGGLDSAFHPLADLWELTFANGLGGNPAWTQLSPSGTGPGSIYSHAAAFDSAHQRMIVFGGADQNNQVRNQVWVLAMGPTFSTCLLYDPNKAVKGGSTVPIKLQLCDGSGNDLSSSSITLHATSVLQTSTSIPGPVEDSGNANPDDDFRFDATLGSTGGYIFNLKTTGLAAGSYKLNFTVTGDSFVYSAPFQVK